MLRHGYRGTIQQEVHVSGYIFVQRSNQKAEPRKVERRQLSYENLPCRKWSNTGQKQGHDEDAIWNCRVCEISSSHGIQLQTDNSCSSQLETYRRLSSRRKQYLHGSSTRTMYTNQTAEKYIQKKNKVHSPTSNESTTQITDSHQRNQALNNSIASSMTFGAKKSTPELPLIQLTLIVLLPLTSVPAGIA
jgi:hypothetical protein